jgi:hypothetical protein
MLLVQFPEGNGINIGDSGCRLKVGATMDFDNFLEQRIRRTGLGDL